MLDDIIKLANDDDDVAAMWLYGSRARNDHHANSDYDLAVVFFTRESDSLERRLKPEIKALEWHQALNVPEDTLSIVDLSSCPVTLGWSILSDGKLLVDKSLDARLRAESRIYSIWELDYQHNQERSSSP